MSAKGQGMVMEEAPKAQEMCTAAPWEVELREAQRRFAGEGGRPAQKTLYFMRHAESMANVHKRNLSRRPCASCQLCAVGFDAPLSKEGLAQLESVRPACQRLLPDLQAIFHSPLRRAEQTARCTFGEEDGAGEFSGGAPSSAVPWVPLTCLKEEQFEEHLQEPGCNVLGGHRTRDGVSSSSEKFRRRIAEFLAFVWNSRFERIALVGHSLWFRALMDIASDAVESVHLENASVWQLTLLPQEADKGVPKIGQWQIVAAPDAKPSKQAQDSHKGLE